MVALILLLVLQDVWQNASQFEPVGMPPDLALPGPCTGHRPPKPITAHRPSGSVGALSNSAPCKTTMWRTQALRGLNRATASCAIMAT
jgi:hypothetical protein